MYSFQMPGEIVHAESPGLFGLSFRQLLGVLGGFMLASWLGLNSIWWAVFFAAIGGMLTRRVRGLYLLQRLVGMLRWYLRTRSADAGVLDPGDLYGGLSGASATSGSGPTTYVVRMPDGVTYTRTNR